MDFLKKRSIAFTVFIIVIVLATVFGVNRSLSSLAGNIEDLFYNGVGGETPINTYLANRINAAKMVTIIADSYPELKQSRDRLYNAYNDLYEAETISEKFSANEEMQEAFTELYSALIESDTISSKHYEDISSYADTINNTQDKIGRSSYNSKVDEYDKILSSFPVLLFRFVIFSDTPERFS